MKLLYSFEWLEPKNHLYMASANLTLLETLAAALERRQPDRKQVTVLDSVVKPQWREMAA